jgi:hypothetical protein
MFKAVTSSMIVIGVIASGALAGSLHDQITGIGAVNNIQLDHGSQTAQSLQNLVVDNQQVIVGAAGEGFFGSIGQALNAAGDCGLVGATQSLNILGNQMQNIGICVEPKSQGESLDVTALQSLARANGFGAADALHTIVLNASQGGANAAGSLDEASTVMGMQTSAIEGLPGANGLVQAGITVSGTQLQGAF